MMLILLLFIMLTLKTLYAYVSIDNIEKSLLTIKSNINRKIYFDLLYIHFDMYFVIAHLHWEINVPTYILNICLCNRIDDILW